MASARSKTRAVVRLIAPLVGALWLAGCAETQLAVHTAKQFQGRETTPKKAQGTYKVGFAYQIDGIWYYPKETFDYAETGIASWYGAEFHGRPTANGEIFDMNAVTAAHKTLQLPSVVRVTNLENGRSLVMRVNDRGPFAKSRLIDLSRRSAQLLGVEGPGTARVRVELLREESLQAKLVAMRGAEPADTAVASAPKPVQVASADAAASSPPPPEARNAPATAFLPVSTSSMAELAPTSEPIVSQEAIRTNNIFIQAGAFVRQDNANRLRGRLAHLGAARVVAMKVGDQSFYRVRVGPIASVSQADRMLDHIVSLGYPEARIVVD